MTKDELVNLMVEVEYLVRRDPMRGLRLNRGHTDEMYDDLADVILKRLEEQS